MNILTLNAGSASLKFRLFRFNASTEQVLAEGTVERASPDDILPAAQKVIAQCKTMGIDALGHRLVHGGSELSEPVLVTPEVLQELRTLSDLDPLHNPTETALIEAGRKLFPNVPSVAVFDTAFHRTLPEVAWRYALPIDLADRLHLRRYGFHGLSHQYVSERLLECLDRSPQGSRLIVCHLGSGASVCAIRDGKSVDTSMGLTPLEGLVMGTRSGDIDPGLLLYLMRSGKMNVETVDDLLNHKSGLLGLSSRSGDVRELEQAAKNGDAKSELALEVFAYHVCKYIGAYTAVLEGLDAVAFTGGIGEHSAGMRLRICRRLTFLGLRMDASRNESVGSEPARISVNGGGVQVWVIATDEERQIARATFQLLKT